MIEYKTAKSCPWNDDINIFANPQYLAVMSSEFGYFTANIDGETVAVVPYTLRRKYGFVKIQLQSAPVLIGQMTIDEKNFLDAIPALARQLGADFIEQPPTYVLFDSYPKGSKWCGFSSYVVNLQAGTEDLWNGIHGKHKNVIRKATPEVEVKFGLEYLADAASLITQTMQRSEMADLPPGFLNKISSAIKDNLFVAVAYHKGMPQGCAVLPYSRHCAYYLYGGSANEPVLGAMNLLHWSAMCKLKELGVRQYDFVGARLHTEDPKLSGIQRFKSRFGGVQKKGYLWKYSLSKVKSFAFDCMLRARSKGKGDIIDQESGKSA